ncbi:hypothetical protein AN641_04765 [Candidatus Epulonipiscioides gigas]|nr:hypothetical protein AN641_04765 [Epulopiscium sp. SCG-C07WGA-EpuloA2]
MIIAFVVEIPFKLLGIGIGVLIRNTNKELGSFSFDLNETSKTKWFKVIIVYCDFITTLLVLYISDYFYSNVTFTSKGLIIASILLSLDTLLEDKDKDKSVTRE